MRFAVAVIFIASTLCAQPSSLHLPSFPGAKKANPAVTASGEFNQEFYENLRNFAEGLYKQKDRPDFRLAVDRDYEKILRDHSDRAFRTNTSPKSEVKVVLEDRFRFFTGLYDNLMIQDAVNRIGQDCSPKWSEKLVTFRLIADPVPSAESLATGTVYITTGLVASLDNKAQLSYVLAHEAAHVAKDHWKTRVMIEHAKEEYAKSQEARAAQIRTFGTLVGLAGGGILGAGFGQTVSNTVLGGAVGAIVGNMIADRASPRIDVDWNVFEEDEADEVAFKSLIDAKLNAAEIPRLYEVMDNLSVKDEKVGMGFWGNRSRMQERLSKVRGFMKANNLEALKLSGNDPEFKRMVSELKRDNGILAYHRDMLDMARSNLEQSVEARGADPAATYYYAKILKATAKTEEDRNKAVELFSQAITNDHANHAYGAYLHRAVALLDRGTPADKKQAAELLENYVDRYGEAMDEIKANRSDRLPPHMDVIIDYMRRAGVDDWKYGMKAPLIPAVATPSPNADVPVLPASAAVPAPPKPAAKRKPGVN